MSSKATALQTLTNHGGKRKGAGGVDPKGGASAIKKLKSHNRTMSIDEANRIMSTSQVDIKAQNKIIRDKQKEIRELKKQIEAAEAVVATAKREKSRIESRNTQASTMVKSDVDLIIEKIASSTSTYCATEGLGRDAIDDVISLGNEADFLRIVDCIKNQVREGTLRGALKAVMEAHKQQKLASSTVAISLRELYLPIVRGAVKPTNLDTWPLVATAMSTALTIAGKPQDGWENDHILLSTALLLAVEQMKKVNPIKYGRYDAGEDKCPILDLVIPTYNAIRTEHGSMNMVKTSLWMLIRKSLLDWVNEVETAKSHAMPTEAAIASKRGFPDVARFLLSPTETSIRLNLSKAGRMNVHRLIDNHMGYGKLRHESEGYGRDRCLYVRKADAEPAAMIQKRKERKQKHNEIFFKFVCRQFVIEVPPPGTSLGLTLADNTTLNMPLVKGVTADSPIANLIPAQFHQDACIAALKSNAIGLVRPKNAKECVTFITNSREGGDKQLEFVFLSLKEEAHVPPAVVDLAQTQSK